MSNRKNNRKNASLSVSDSVRASIKKLVNSVNVDYAAMSHRIFESMSIAARVDATLIRDIATIHHVNTVVTSVEYCLKYYVYDCFMKSICYKNIADVELDNNAFITSDKFKMLIANHYDDRFMIIMHNNVVVLVVCINNKYINYLDYIDFASKCVVEYMKTHLSSYDKHDIENKMKRVILKL